MIALLLACALLTTPVLGADREAGGDSPRLVTLSPHLAELAAAVGFEGDVVGVSRYTDYPPSMRERTVVTDAFHLNREALLALQPTLVIAWAQSTPKRHVEWLRQAGLEVLVVRTDSLTAVAQAMREIAAAAGAPTAGGRTANAYRDELAGLRERYAGLPERSVLVQLGRDPLYALGADPLINEALAVCGLRNVFADQDKLALMTNAEAVLAADPHYLLSASDQAQDNPLSHWRRYEGLAAVAAKRLWLVDGDELFRATPRLLHGIRSLCERRQAEFD